MEKSIEKELRNLLYVRNGNLFVYCQPQSWCTSSLFKEWIKVIFLQYDKEYGEKCLLIMDKASEHISKDSLSFLDENKINYVFNTRRNDMPMSTINVAVNKIFKAQVIFFNLLDYFYKVWYKDIIIIKKYWK